MLEKTDRLRRRRQIGGDPPEKEEKIRRPPAIAPPRSTAFAAAPTALSKRSATNFLEIRAVRDVEVEHLLTELRFLRSRFSSEQLQKPLFQVFEETLPNFSVVNDERNKKVGVKWREKESCNDVHASLLQRLSIPRFTGFEYSTNAGRMNFGGADNLHFKD